MHRSLPMLALVTLTACATATPPAIESSRTVAVPADQARSRVAEAIRNLGLTPAGSTGALTASFGAGTTGAWAACPRKLVYDRQSTDVRSDWASPQGEAGTVTASFSPTGAGTQVTISTRAEASYTNRFFNTQETGPCRSTGELERRLLDAAAGG